MLKLNDLLHLTDDELQITKIRLNRRSTNGQNPIDIYKRNPKELLDWNYYNNKSYKAGQISIGLVDMGNHRWLLFTVGRIDRLLPQPINTNGGTGGVQVDYTTLTKYESFFGRTIVSYHNKSRQLFRDALSVGKHDTEPLIDQLVVQEILPSVYNGFDFPGYDKVSLSYDELSTIVQGDYPSYKNALSHQKAVYLQTDKATGKMYVGSATEESGMLLSRWTTYVQNGHGGNDGLRALIAEKGLAYVQKNFQYTIIENFNSKVDDHYIFERESYWKETLQTRKFGYNKN